MRDVSTTQWTVRVHTEDPMTARQFINALDKVLSAGDPDQQFVVGMDPTPGWE